MQAERFNFETPQRPGSHTPALKMAAKRYTIRSSRTDTDGLTLLFAHCIGSHKEQWEPVIQQLFANSNMRRNARRIREVWAFDWQNHGDSAILNRQLLKTRPEGVTAYEWSRAIAAFVRSPRMRGHRIVPIGHSAGAAAMLLTTTEISRQFLVYPAIILIEPTMVTRELFNAHLEDRMASMDFAVAATATRRDTWTSKEHAFNYFSKRIPWGMWDSRIVRLYTEDGLEKSPSGSVTLKCDRKQEAVSFPDVEPHFEGAVQLSRICHAVPIHIIWGTRNDLVPEFIQESLSDVAEGRIAASVTKIEDAGHMVVQEQPDALAWAISDVLDTLNMDSPVEKSKL